MKFSERYGYVKPIEVLKRGPLDKECLTALCNCYDHLDHWLNEYDVDKHHEYDESYTEMEETIWCFFMHQRRNDFYIRNGHKIAATFYLLSDDYEWYTKFDLIEFSIRILRIHHQEDKRYQSIIDVFITLINSAFKQLNYAYRVVDDLIVEITDQEEIAAIEEAPKVSSSVKTHLTEGLKLLSERPTPDYRNSIKESISAVEALCREITGETKLGPALNALEKKGIVIPTYLKSGFEKLYVYTNDARTGIRHAQMDGIEAPQYDEAKFMLVACSAFINYIQGKRGG